MFEQDGSASSTKRESLTSHITGTISDLTDSISQARSQRRKASLPPRIAPKVDEASELHISKKRFFYRWSWRGIKTSFT